MNPQVDQYIINNTRWKNEIILLRSIILECELTEELKWKTPCYSFESNNILLINSLKNYCAIGFFKGVLLNDATNLLVAPGENSNYVRMFKFTNIEKIKNLKIEIQNYIYEAIEIERAGLRVEKQKSKLELPAELIQILNFDIALSDAFYALSPGRQRGYSLHFSSAKQSKTRISRIEKCIPKILNGYGFHDCTCGLSKRKPTCDGSHKILKHESEG